MLSTESMLHCELLPTTVLLVTVIRGHPDYVYILIRPFPPNLWKTISYFLQQLVLVNASNGQTAGVNSFKAFSTEHVARRAATHTTVIRW